MNDKNTFSEQQLLNFIRIAALCSILFASLLVFNTIFYSSTTYDEPFHLSWSIRLLDDKITERESVYNWISTTPITLINIGVQRLFSSLGLLVGTDPLLLQRSAGFIWFYLLLAASYFLTRFFATEQTAWFAVIVMCLEPNIVAHSALVGTDIPFVSLAILSIYATIRFSKYPDNFSIVLLSLSCSLALITKFSSFILIPFVAIVPLILNAFSIHSIYEFSRKWLLVMFLTTISFLAFVNYFYFGIGTMRPFSDFHFFAPSFQSIQNSFPSLRLPIPADFITAYDHLSQAGKRAEWNNILFQNWYGQGVWFYYLALWVFKTPILLIAVSILGGMRLLTHNRYMMRDYAFSCVIIFAILVLIYFSYFVKIQVGYRYALLCVPLLTIVSAVSLLKDVSLKTTLVIIMLVIAGSTLELLPYSKNLLSFSNSLIHEKKNAYKILADSNIDWGQRRAQLPKLLNQYNIASAPIDPFHILPGKNIISVNMLLGVFWNPEKYRWVRENLSPQYHMDHTYLVYNVSENEFISYLSQQRALEESDDKFCDITINDSQKTISINSEMKICSKARGDHSVLRVKVKRGTVQSGRVQYGQCMGEDNVMQLRHTVWYYVPKESSSAFCLKPRSNNGSATVDIDIFSVSAFLNRDYDKHP